MYIYRFQEQHDITISKIALLEIAKIIRRILNSPRSPVEDPSLRMTPTAHRRQGGE